MKILNKKSIKRFCLIVPLLLGVLVFGCKCNSSKQPPNPLEGFYVSALHDIHSNKPIMDDYQNYINELFLKNGDFVGSVEFLENGTGQHAVNIKVGVNGTWWEHVLIYDQNNKRVKVIKLRDGKYRS